MERPASAIKELLENSIDAASTAVTVEIRNGGITFIRVTDNGTGIDPEDVPSAFLRHATSKIRSASDLDSIGTLGFRGEALASIAAVSRLEMLTKTKDAPFGTSIRLEGGEIASVSEAGCPAGTTVIVRDLFYNTPARMKFLKRDVTEASAVYAVVEKIALSHSEISFRFLKDGKEELHTPGDGRLISDIYAVYGRQYAEGLMPVDYSLEGIAVQGFVSRPAVSRPNRNMQVFFINGRFIKSRTIMAALEEAYKNSIMIGKFPGCVLMLRMNCSLVDVNVHPAKIEVRFANEHNVFDAVYYAVKTSLAKNDVRPEFSMKPENAGQFRMDEKPRPASQLSFDIMKIAPEKQDAPVELRSTASAAYLPVQNESHVPPARAVPVPASAADQARPAPVFRPSDNRETPESGPKREVGAPRPAKILGEAFCTYILVESEDDILLIDKHAAHERILFEQLKAAGKSSAQLLLNPVTLSLSPAEHEALLQNRDALRESGFSVEDFGGSTVMVREAPMQLAGGKIAGAIEEIAGYLTLGKKDLTPESMDWLYHSVACRAAVKAGDKSSLMEIENLVERVMKFDDIRYCPHGRPVAVTLSRKDIEKQFGRS